MLSTEKAFVIRQMYWLIAAFYGIGKLFFGMIQYGVKFYEVARC